MYVHGCTLGSLKLREASYDCCHHGHNSDQYKKIVIKQHVVLRFIFFFVNKRSWKKCSDITAFWDT